MVALRRFFELRVILLMAALFPVTPALSAAERPAPCPALVARLDGAGVDPLRELFARGGFGKYYGRPEMRPVVNAVTHLHPIAMFNPIELTGSVSEKEGVLLVRLDGVGPGKAENKPLFHTLSQMKGATAGFVEPFVKNDHVDSTLIKAIAAVTEGIENRVKANPNLRSVVIEAIDVQNVHLMGILQRKLGFRVIGHRITGMLGSAATLRLEIPLNGP